MLFFQNLIWRKLDDKINDNNPNKNKGFTAVIGYNLPRWYGAIISQITRRLDFVLNVFRLWV